MKDKVQKIPIKLKSLREEREILRSNSNRSRMLISPIFELHRPLSNDKLKIQNRTPVLAKLQKIESPRSIYENCIDSNIQLIEKANAAMEALEITIKGKSKNAGLLYKKDNGERILKSGIAYKSNLKNESTASNDIQAKLKKDKNTKNLISWTKAKRKNFLKPKPKC